MAVQVPQPVETRIRKKWSRRAKITGYSLLALYVAFVVLSIFVMKSGIFVFFLTTSAFAAAVRYLRVGQVLHTRHDAALLDEDARALAREYEHKIRIEGQREVSRGTLSMPEKVSEGELSFVPEAGRLSHSADD